MADDKEFTVQEIKNVVASMGNKKMPDDGITSEISKSCRNPTQVHNSYLQQLPQEWNFSHEVEKSKNFANN